MPGLGTIINVALLIAGGVAGLFCGKLVKERLRDSLIKCCGVCTIFIGISGALKEMLVVGQDGKLGTQGTLMMIICIAVGVLLGEIINIYKWIEKFGAWLRHMSKSDGDKNFINGFVTATVTVCVGAMAIVGALEDGLNGNYTILITKGILDLIIVMIMTASLGKGCIFSAIPVAIFQGVFTVLARQIQPIMTEPALSNLSLVGNVLIFMIGVNLVWGEKFKVANFLPALVFAVAWTYMPWA